MKKNISIVLIGAGKVGTVLSKKLYERGYNFVGIIDLDLNKARNLAKKVKAALFSNEIKDIPKEANFIIISVPDSQIKVVSKKISKLPLHFNSLKVCHVSGCLSSDELKPIKNRGSIVFSMHPYQSFPDSKNTKNLDSIYYGIEGEKTLFAKKIVKALGGNYIIIPKNLKSLYHVSGAFASNYLLVLLSVVNNILYHIIGDKKKAKGVFRPILENTLYNYFNTDFKNSITGPIVRGDAITVEKHLKALKKYDKNIYDLYKKFGQILLKEIEGNLSRKNNYKKILKLLA
ncbi:MAG TPA: Rossmann-like and DUF2520 domain-containing protein [Ignavibacteria bacterium]